MRIDSATGANSSLTGSFLSNNGVLSSSAQIASEISGSSTSLSSSLASRVTTEENNIDVLQAHQSNIHAFTASADGEITALMGATSSYAAKTAISGAFTSTSASIASDIASNVSNISSIGSFTASLDSDITTFSLPSSTTISTFGKSLVDDADASAARTTLGLGTAATTAATDYATAAQGTTADNALPKTGGQMTGNITFSGAQTVDGRDLSADGTKLDTIEENADVTDTANVTAAGALMDSEVDADIKTLSLPANTTISAFGKTLVDDADAAAGRTTLGLGTVATLNSIDISTNTNLAVSDTTGQTGIDLTLSDDTLSGVVSGLGTGASPTFSGLTVSNDVTINGDLTVLGDATELQVSSLNVEDINITIASGAADSAAANGAGITIAGANETLTWDHGNSRFSFSDDLNVAGNITLSGTVDGRDVATDGTKLDGIEASADVTDTANVTAAGALMDSEVTNLAQVKAFNSSDYATAAQGTTADAALARSGGQMTGNITFLGAQTVDGRDLSADGTKLDGIEASADVTDTANVTAAGALMDSEVSSLSGIKTLTVPDSTTISAFGKSLVDDVDAGAAKTTLGLENVTNESKTTMFSSPTFTGTVSGVTAAHVGLGNVTNESKATMFSSPTFTGTVSGVTAAHVGLGNVTNESKATMFSSPTFTGTVSGVTAGHVGLGPSADVQFDSLGIGTAASGVTGEIRATGDITAFYSSDERLKENFAPLTGALDKVKAIGGYEFDWKDGIEEIVSKKGHDIGVKAQELQAQYPELVHERDNGYLAVDYIKLTAVLIEAVKELSAKVEELSK
jgi:hypothetical protein